MIGPTELRYLLETARCQHISRAAERLGLSQPALSHSIKKVEDELGLALFLRSKKGVKLTPAGERFLEKAEGLLQSWTDLFDSVHREQDEVAGVIRWGCHTAVAQYMMPHVLPQLLKKHPRLQIHLKHGLSRHLTEDVISSRLDLAFAVNPVRHPDLVIKEICRDKVTLWTSKSCRNPDVLMLEPDLLQSQDLLMKLDKAGWRFPRRMESSSLEVLSQLLRSGAGCAILPERVVKAFSIRDLQAMPGAPVFMDRICLVSRVDFKSSRTGREILTALNELPTKMES